MTDISQNGIGRLPLKGPRADYAIMKEGRPIMFFECKSADVNLDDIQTAQLAGCCAATDARFGVLTNALKSAVYSGNTSVRSNTSYPSDVIKGIIRAFLVAASV